MDEVVARPVWPSALIVPHVPQAGVVEERARRVKHGRVPVERVESRAVVRGHRWDRVEMKFW